ncbi:MAG: hypothetical protein ABIS17_07635 [Casimicrobiaceae bacterium]
MNATVDLKFLLRRAAAPMLVWVVTALSQMAHAAGVAMVTDLQGRATASSEAKTRDLTILAELEAFAKVQLEPAAMLVALYLDSGDEYVFKGPSTIEFKPGAPEVQSGAKAQRRNLSLGKGGRDVRIKPVGVTQAATVMRSVRPVARIQPLTLNKTRTLERSPEFRWKELRPGQRYGFELDDETGRTVFKANVDAPQLRLPANVQIKESAPYTWKVSAQLPDGTKYSSSAEFAVAATGLRAQAEFLRPSASAALSTRIAYAAWLEGMELKDEARKYWKAAASERPDDARLKQLAEQ